MVADKDNDDNSHLKEALFTVSDGVIGAGILVVLGVLLGNWLDGQFHMAPIMLIICALVGGGLGLARLVKKSMLIGQDSSKKVPPPPPLDKQS